MRGRPGPDPAPDDPMDGLMPADRDARPDDPEGPAAPDWRRLHALGLPEGSVRALLALGLFGTIWGAMVLGPDRALPGYLRDLLFIILGHYFASRRRADLEPLPGPPPLFLPRGTIRLVLIAGFVAVAASLYTRGHLDGFPRNPAGMTLLLVGGFLLGVVLGRIKGWLAGGGRRPSRLVEDVKAVVALGAAAILAALVWDQSAPFLPVAVHEAMNRLPGSLGQDGPGELLAAVVGFYFGSRS